MLQGRQQSSWNRTESRSKTTPPYSLDLNPIEYVWKKMKEILRRDFPSLYLLKDSEANRAKVADALKVA
jgi:transposase